jgi:hypothetical protein
MIEGKSMQASWQLFAVFADTPSGFTWRWQKERASVPVASAAFHYYFDCVSDARANGYTGPRPPGPKVPVERLLEHPVGTQSASASPF